MKRLYSTVRSLTRWLVVRYEQHGLFQMYLAASTLAVSGLAVASPFMLLLQFEMFDKGLLAVLVAILGALAILIFYVPVALAGLIIHERLLVFLGVYKVLGIKNNKLHNAIKLWADRKSEE